MIVYVGNSVQKIKQEPFYRFLPIFSIISAGIVEFCKEFYPTLKDHEGIKIICEAVIAGFYFLAGYYGTVMLQESEERNFGWEEFLRL